MNMNKPPDETLKQGRNRSWLLVKFSYDRNPYSISILNKKMFLFFLIIGSLFHDIFFCLIVYAVSCIFLCFRLSSFLCVENDLLCSLERSFFYYLKIHATESIDISQKRVHINIVTNILSFFITILMYS